MKKKDTINPITMVLMDNYTEQIFDAAIIYLKFEENLKNNKENNGNTKIYMITKEFLDNFKNKIFYSESKDLFIEEKKDENLPKFQEKVKDYSLNELELIIFGEFNLYGDLDLIEEDLEKGFDFVNDEFLEKLEFEFEDIMKQSNVSYYKKNNNVIVIFSDNSKLLISENNGKYKYSAIPAPIKDLKGPSTLKKIKTFKMTNLNKAKTNKEK